MPVIGDEEDVFRPFSIGGDLGALHADVARLHGCSYGREQTRPVGGADLHEGAIVFIIL